MLPTLVTIRGRQWWTCPFMYTLHRTRKDAQHGRRGAPEWRVVDAGFRRAGY